MPKGLKGLKPVVVSLQKTKLYSLLILPYRTAIQKVQKPEHSYGLVQDLNLINWAEFLPLTPFTRLPSTSHFSVLDFKRCFLHSSPGPLLPRPFHIFLWKDPDTKCHWGILGSPFQDTALWPGSFSQPVQPHSQHPAPVWRQPALRRPSYNPSLQHTSTLLQFLSGMNYSDPSKTAITSSRPLNFNLGHAHL